MNRPRTPLSTDTLERARYFPRQVVTPSDLQQDREYLLHKLRRHNRLLHHWGKMLGLTVTPFLDADVDVLLNNPMLIPAAQDLMTQLRSITDAEERKKKRAAIVEQLAQSILKVSAGFAHDPVGNELYLPHDVYLHTTLELDNSLVVYPVECWSQANPRQITRSGAYVLIVEAMEAEAHAVRAGTARCGDHPEQFEWSRLRDTLRFRLLPKDKYVAEPYANDVEKLNGETKFNYIKLADVPFETTGVLGTVVSTPPT